jgi:hypothetical protein
MRLKMLELASARSPQELFSIAREFLNNLGRWLHLLQTIDSSRWQRWPDGKKP